jgi:hypothetical protein
MSRTNAEKLKTLIEFAEVGATEIERLRAENSRLLLRLKEAERLLDLARSRIGIFMDGSKTHMWVQEYDSWKTPPPKEPEA